ncbi:MAG: hypothetical protein ACI80V_000560, partial [Rhodothermales bacterium]
MDYSIFRQGRALQVGPQSRKPQSSKDAFVMP